MTLLQAINEDYASPGIVLLILIILLFYFLPSIIGRNKRNFVSILVLNFFLGWTFIGWIVALIWAVSPDKNPIIIYNTDSEKSLKPNIVKTDELLKFKQLLDNGAISQQEYDIEKNKILNNS